MALPETQTEAGYAPAKKSYGGSPLLWLIMVLAVGAAGVWIAGYLA